MRFASYALLAVLLAHATAAEVATTSAHSVTVTVAVEQVAGDRAVLVGRFVPDAAVSPPLHLYGIDLVGTLGLASRLALAPGGPAEATGPLSADQPTHDLDGLPVYPEGPIELRLPIRLPAGPTGSQIPVEVLVSYMACSTVTCKNPVKDARLTLTLPAHPRAAQPTSTPVKPAATTDPAALTAAVAAALAAERPALRRALHDEVQAALAESSSGIRWRRPTTVAEADAAIAEAKAAGRAAILDFTGPSCTVCQRMARTVLRDRRTIAAWNAQVPIEIDTDTHGELAAWQTTRFKTQNRPLYVRLDPDGGEQRWSEIFVPADATTMERFLAWSAGRGAGADVTLATGLAGFLLLAIAGGLFTLVMPCTYPMIPFTVTFFAKQSASGRSLLPLALAYAGGIVVCFIAIGALLAGLLQKNPALLSGDPWTNLVFAIVFILLGLSLLGVFLLRLPSGVQNALGGGRGGYLGALGMGLTFVVTAFACTAPFAGLVLGALASDSGGAVWLRALGGMAVYGLTIAIPFFVLAISPGLLKRLPRAGGWMNEFKVVGGIVEIAAALKFLNIADHRWGWGIFGRDAVFALWAAGMAVIAVYVLGRLRFAGDDEVRTIGAGRLLTGAVFIAIALWLASGVFGNDLGQLESFLAPEI